MITSKDSVNKLNTKRLSWLKTEIEFDTKDSVKVIRSVSNYSLKAAESARKCSLNVIGSVSEHSLKVAGSDRKCSWKVIGLARIIV
jgi:hypothetical protein